MTAEYVKNYMTVNPEKQAALSDWYISPIAGKMQQISVLLNKGKEWKYACRYPVKDNAVAIVGHSMPYQSFLFEPQAGVNTGSMGQVTAIEPKLTIKRSHAIEVDFVFSRDPEKRDIAQCVKYLKFGSDDYPKTLQLDKNIGRIRPLSYFIRRILAAASILAHPRMVKAEDLEMAKREILSEKVIDLPMTKLHWGPPEDIGISFLDTHVFTPEIDAIFEEIGKELNHRSWADGELSTLSGCLERLVSLDTVRTFVNRYAHMGAVAIMVRGGFKNLLAAYLSVNPSVDYEQMCNALSKIGNKETYALLRDAAK